MLHEDPSCDGVVLNIDVTDGGKSHSMRLSIAYEGAIGIICIPLLALTITILLLRFLNCSHVLCDVSMSVSFYLIHTYHILYSN